MEESAFWASKRPLASTQRHNPQEQLLVIKLCRSMCFPGGCHTSSTPPANRFQKLWRFSKSVFFNRTRRGEQRCFWSNGSSGRAQWQRRSCTRRYESLNPATIISKKMETWNIIIQTVHFFYNWVLFCLFNCQTLSFYCIQKINTKNINYI